ncbi:hypothetical protein BH11PLA1_BH11PLA1_12530 [soil metagenome]
MDAYERLKQLIVEAEADVMKGLGGNKAAKVRARKKMQEIKAAAQDVRQALLSDKPGEGAEGEDADEDGASAGGQKKADGGMPAKG